MSFTERGSMMSPRIGRTIGLQRGHIDPSTLVLTFHYREWVEDGDQWSWEQRQQELALHTHYRLDKRRGVIELLDDPFWNQQGLWAAGDRAEPLLYKGQVKHDRGQRIEFAYEHYAPEEVGDPSSVDLEAIDAAASARLGYDVKKYSPTPKEKELPPAPWDWEEKVAPI